MPSTSMVVAVVASYGFLKNFSPDHQYFADYLTGPKNFTRDQVTQEIYPASTYCNLIVTPLIFLVIDLLQYKPVIILSAFSLIFCKAFLLFGSTVFHMQLAEMAYAISKAANLSYITYIYTQIDNETYQAATSVIYISPKLGLILSSLVSQFLLLYKLISLGNLLVLSLPACFLALLVSFFFPSSKCSTAKKTEKSTVFVVQKQEISDPTSREIVKEVKHLWMEFKFTFTNPYLLKLCIWQAISTGFVELVMHYYAQALWSEVSGKENIYNGTAHVMYMAFSMIGCYIAGKVNIKWEENMDMVMGVMIVLEGSFVVISSRSRSVYWEYLYHTVYAVLYDVILILCRAEMAQHLENFGLIFGIVQFVTIILQSALTFILTSQQGLALPIRNQFSVIGWSLVAFGAAFVLKGFRNFFRPSGSIDIQQTNVKRY